jgi:hypothetical protein
MATGGPTDRACEAGNHSRDIWSHEVPPGILDRGAHRMLSGDAAPFGAQAQPFQGLSLAHLAFSLPWCRDHKRKR